MRYFRHAFRQLAKSPGFTAVGVIVFSLGIGASTVIFSIVHALLVAPLHYGNAGELVKIQSLHKEQGASDLAPATYGDLLTANTSFVTFAAQYYYYVNLTGTAVPVLLNSADVTADYFKLFGVAPSLGRWWNDDDIKPGAAPVVVLSDAVWRSQFNSSDSVIGKKIKLDDIAYTVIGVMPASFKEPFEVAQLWRPMRPGADNLLDRTSRYWTVFARLKPGVPLEQANVELATVARQLEQAHPKNYEDWTIRAADLHRLIVGDYRTGLLVVLGAVACVMTITCANVAGLSTVRAMARRKELAIRTALGASRPQLMLQLVTESLLLATIGGSGGVLIGSWGLDALLVSLPGGWLPRAGEIGINLPVLATSLAVTALTGIASGLAPAFAASRIDANEALKDFSRGSAVPSSRFLRSTLLVAELTLTLVLLTGTGLLGRSFIGLLHKKSGIDAERILSLTVSLPGKRYDDPAKCWDFFSRAQTAVAALPGVDATGFTQTSPFRWGIPIGFAPLRSGQMVSTDAPSQAFTDSVSVDYFKTMGVPLRAGRIFTEADDYKTAPKVILSESAARRYFGTGNPIGRYITAGPQARFEVVGVVGDIRRAGLTVETPLQVYRPFAQRTPPFATLMVRTSLPPATLTKSVQAALWRIDPDIPISDVATMDTFVSRSVAQPRLYFTLFGLFAALGLLLAGIGLYGQIAYSVEQRTREFGIRTALGASPREVLLLVFREGAGPIMVGLTLGVAGSFAATRLLRTMVFNTSLTDPAVFLAVPLLLVAVTILACWLPARRATKVDPVVALRTD